MQMQKGLGSLIGSEAGGSDHSTKREGMSLGAVEKETGTFTHSSVELNAAPLKNLRPTQNVQRKTQPFPAP